MTQNRQWGKQLIAYIAITDHGCQEMHFNKAPMQYHFQYLLGGSGGEVMISE